MRRHTKSTLKDVAHRANVSATTVSLFASGREDVCSSDTAERIREAIAHLRYTPNSLSRSLRTRSTRTIGISIGRPARMKEPTFSYLDRLWSGIDAATDEADYSQLYYPVAVRYGTSLDPFLDGRIDGLLMATGMTDYRPRDIAEVGMPIVLVGSSLDIPEGCGAVYANEADAMLLGLDHLWSLGHRRIAHIAGPCAGLPDATPFSGGGMTAALTRRDTFTRWMSQRDALDPRLVRSVPSWVTAESLDSVTTMVNEWLDSPNPPTAIFSANDAFALVAMGVIQSRGLNVPGDISVVGIDNQINAMRAQPELTSIEVPAEEIGELSVKVLLKLISGASIDECRIQVPVTKLIVRGTTASRA